MSLIVTDEGREFLLDKLSIPPESEKPVLAALVGLQIDDDVERKARVYDLLFHQPVSLAEHPVQRSVFDVMQEYSNHRSYIDVEEKYYKLLRGAETDDEALVLDVLAWVLDEQVEWDDFSEHIEDRKA